MNGRRKREGRTLKQLELRIISELMKNSRKTDRVLAKAVGTSQSTVNRIIKKLEKEGYIREYTLIPNFKQLGYEIMAVTFIKVKKGATEKGMAETRRIVQDRIKDANPEIIMFESGIGMECTGMVISLHKDYTGFSKFMRELKEGIFLEQSCESFLINLREEDSFRHLTLSTLANHVLTMKAEADKTTQA